MRKKAKHKDEQHPDSETAPGTLPTADDSEQESYRVTDRRHSADDEWQARGDDTDAGEPLRQPTIIDEYRQRTEAAERKLQEYIEAHKQFRAEQDQVRQRLQRDVARRVERQFSELVSDLLATVDHLDLALSHVADVPEAASLAEGVRLARDGFLATLERSGVEKFIPDGQPFDPNEAEAIRMDPVDSAERDGIVTETLRPGYRLGDSLVRPAQVAVGRAQ